MSSAGSTSIPVVGGRSHRFRVHTNWEQLPAGWQLNEAVGVAIDSQDRVFVFSRSAHPVTIFDRQGRFLAAWGEGMFSRPHGIYIGADDAVWCTDDYHQVVRKFTPDGKLLLTLGTPEQPSDTGLADLDYRTIRQAAGPFNLPTNVALSAAGEIYVSDGYGNARVHKFSPDGRLLLSWGEPGTGPGQFALPHGVGVGRDGTVYVSDRENSRVQLFSPDGRYLDQWTDVVRPCLTVCDADDNVYVSEMGFRVGMYPGNHPPGPNASGGRVSIFNRRGELLARWGGGLRPGTAGDFFAPHGIALDSRGDLYLGEVRPGPYASDTNPPVPAPAGAPLLHKFVRL